MVTGGNSPTQSRVGEKIALHAQSEGERKNTPNNYRTDKALRVSQKNERDPAERNERESGELIDH